jgi:4'-phosphopantetheinyl transferase
MKFTEDIFTFSKKKTQIYITTNWINLPSDEAYIQLLASENEYYLSLKTDKRRKEFLLVRFLRNKFFPGKEIKYTSVGAPYFKDKSYSISISHTSAYIALAVTTEGRIGIDIELIQDKIITLGQKFMHQDEILTIESSNDSIHYTQFWCAKEALYKWTNITGISFQNDLSIFHENMKNWYGISNRISEGIIPLEMIEFNNHILCYTY